MNRKPEFAMKVRPKTAVTVMFLVVSLCARPLPAQSLKHPEPYLISVDPAGARQGQSVRVSLRGPGIPGGENRVLVEGPPGVTVGKVETVQAGHVQVQLTVAADAEPGRRRIRVHNMADGLTNFRWFFVGTLPEVAEVEPNNSLKTAQTVELPTVVNGVVNPTLDTDWFQFRARSGQRIVAAVLAHGMDGFVDYRKGFLDTSVTITDARGTVLGTSEDEIGLDPVLSVDIPTDGDYSVEVKSLGYKGSLHASYRLTLGEVPYPTGVFPNGTGVYDRALIDSESDSSPPFRLSGPNMPPLPFRIPNAGRTVRHEFPSLNPLPVRHVTFPAAPTRDVTLLTSDIPESIESEPNSTSAQAMPLRVPVNVNGRFESPGDEDWFRISLKKGEGILLQTMAQRHLRAPVDTEIRVLDSTGRQVATNDDGAAFGSYSQCAHDFVSNDSWLAFTPPADGEWFVQVRDLNGGGRARSVYRLSVEPLQPDLLLYQWPDSVPVWGPGTTASFVVEVMKWGPLHEDVEVRVEGLPDGWNGGVANWPKTWYPHYQGTGTVKLLLTITAPADAEIGTIVPFRVVGRSEQNGRKIEREAHYMTLYGPSHNDRMHVRHSSVAQAVVAGYRDASVSTDTTEVTGKAGETVSVPVRIRRHGEGSPTIGIVANGPTPSAGCGWSSPLTLNANQSEAVCQISLAGREPGRYAIVIARSWASDTRAGRSGPCTKTFWLNIEPATTQ